jgi:Mg2+ and Co2+ transporter CorA
MKHEVKRLPLTECKWENNGVRYTGRKRVKFPDAVVAEHNRDIDRAAAICENQWAVFQRVIDQSDSQATSAEIELEERRDEFRDESDKMEKTIERLRDNLVTKRKIIGAQRRAIKQLRKQCLYLIKEDEKNADTIS